MSETADRYRRLFGDCAAKVAQVSPDQWGAPSPCEGWTADDQTTLPALLKRRA
jgi:hypothetical protein